jgi:hypothetical protein
VRPNRIMKGVPKRCVKLVIGTLLPDEAKEAKP